MIKEILVFYNLVGLGLYRLVLIDMQYIVRGFV